MAINTRRNFFGKIAAMAAFVTGAPKLFAQQAPAGGGSNMASTSQRRQRYSSPPQRR